MLTSEPSNLILRNILPASSTVQRATPLKLDGLNLKLGSGKQLLDPTKVLASAVSVPVSTVTAAPSSKVDVMKAIAIVGPPEAPVVAAEKQPLPVSSVATVPEPPALLAKTDPAPIATRGAASLKRNLTM